MLDSFKEELYEGDKVNLVLAGFDVSDFKTAEVIKDDKGNLAFLININGKYQIFSKKAIVARGFTIAKLDYEGKKEREKLFN